MDRRSICELWRKLYQRFRDEYRQWVEIARVCLETKTLRFEWDRTTSAERIDDGRRSGWIATPNLRARLFQDLLIIDRFPGDQPLDDVKQTQALSRLSCFGWKQLRVCRRIVDELGEQNCSACRKGAASPPEMEGAGMPVADALFSGSFAINGVKGKGDLDELGGHHASSGEMARCQYGCQANVVFVVSNGSRTSGP
jgi:hypothetical protein